MDRYRVAQLRGAPASRRTRTRREDRPPAAKCSTINRTIGLLAQILDVVVEYGHLPANPASGKRRKLKTANPHGLTSTQRQITALLDAAAELDGESRANRQHVNCRGQLATLIFAGPRIGEFLNLRNRDVDLAGGWITATESKTDAGRGREVKIRPVLRDVLAAHRPLGADPNTYVFGTAHGKPQNSSNVRARVVTKAVERANERLQETGEPPLPPLTPHVLRRTFASLLYAIGETPPVVMAELGHTDPDLALSIYAPAMRRDDAENERLRALVNGDSFGNFGSAAEIEPTTEPMERAA